MTYLEQTLPNATEQQRQELQALAVQANADAFAAKRAMENVNKDFKTYEKAQTKADASEAKVLATCPWTLEQVLDVDWLPQGSQP